MGQKSKWIAVTVDDGETTSAATDLEHGYHYLGVIIPTITSATVTVHISNHKTGTYVAAYKQKGEAVGDTAQITTAAATTHALTFDICGAQHIKIVCGASQSGGDTFYVRGFD